MPGSRSEAPPGAPPPAPGTRKRLSPAEREALIVDGGLTAAGPELSKRFPRSSGRHARVSGVTKGSTGEAPDLKRLDE